MTCELFSAQMYTQRPGSDIPLPQEFVDHLRTCASCSRNFGRMVERDALIRTTMHSVPPSSNLEASILSGLALERGSFSATGISKIGSWRSWLWIPANVAVLVVTVTLFYAQWQSHVALQQVAALLHEPPALNLEAGDRGEILRWSEQIEPGSGQLPSRLNRIQFLGAAAVRVNNHAAVFLRMKHEPRASLLVLDHPSLGSRQITSRNADNGSLAYWSEQKKTYVLLFQGDKSELQSYMQRMGITT